MRYKRVRVFLSVLLLGETVFQFLSASSDRIEVRDTLLPSRPDSRPFSSRRDRHGRKVVKFRLNLRTQGSIGKRPETF